MELCMDGSLSNFTVQAICKMLDTIRVHLISYHGSVRGYHYYYGYHDGSWKDSNSYWSDSKDHYMTIYLTEKTAVRLAVAMRERTISEQQIFRENAGNYSITKLMLLREIANQHLTSDI